MNIKGLPDWHSPGIEGNDAIYTHAQKHDFIGFVYLVEAGGRKYLGKKMFRRKQATGHQTDWRRHVGPNIEMQQLAKENPAGVKRKILYFGRSRVDLTYMEAAELIERKVLFSDEYLNQ